VAQNDPKVERDIMIAEKRDTRATTS